MAKRNLNGRAVSHGCSPMAVTPVTLSPRRLSCIRVWELSAPAGLGHTRCAHPVTFQSQRSSGSGLYIHLWKPPSQNSPGHTAVLSVVCRSSRPGQRVHNQPCYRCAEPSLIFVTAQTLAQGAQTQVSRRLSPPAPDAGHSPAATCSELCLKEASFT